MEQTYKIPEQYKKNIEEMVKWHERKLSTMVSSADRIRQMNANFAIGNKINPDIAFTNIEEVIEDSFNAVGHEIKALCRQETELHPKSMLHEISSLFNQYEQEVLSGEFGDFLDSIDEMSHKEASFSAKHKHWYLGGKMLQKEEEFSERERFSENHYVQFSQIIDSVRNAVSDIAASNIEMGRVGSEEEIIETRKQSFDNIESYNEYIEQVQEDVVNDLGSLKQQLLSGRLSDEAIDKAFLDIERKVFDIFPWPEFNDETANIAAQRVDKAMLPAMRKFEAYSHSFYMEVNNNERLEYEIQNSLGRIEQNARDLADEFSIGVVDDQAKIDYLKEAQFLIEVVQNEGLTNNIREEAEAELVKSIKELGYENFGQIMNECLHDYECVYGGINLEVISNYYNQNEAKFNLLASVTDIYNSIQNGEHLGNNAYDFCAQYAEIKNTIDNLEDESLLNETIVLKSNSKAVEISLEEAMTRIDNTLQAGCFDLLVQPADIILMAESQLEYDEELENILQLANEEILNCMGTLNEEYLLNNDTQIVSAELHEHENKLRSIAEMIQPETYDPAKNVESRVKSHILSQAEKIHSISESVGLLHEAQHIGYDEMTEEQDEAVNNYLGYLGEEKCASIFDFVNALKYEIEFNNGLEAYHDMDVQEQEKMYSVYSIAHADVAARDVDSFIERIEKSMADGEISQDDALEEIEDKKYWIDEATGYHGDMIDDEKREKINEAGNKLDKVYNHIYFNHNLGKQDPLKENDNKEGQEL